MLNVKTKFGFKKGHVRRAVHPNFSVFDFFVHTRTYIYSAYVGGGGRTAVYIITIILLNIYIIERSRGGRLKNNDGIVCGIQF